jgi:tRNA(Ile)-lysidine synthase
MRKPTTSLLDKKFLEHCLKRKFFRKGDRVLLAVSGGMDSIALCRFLETFKKNLPIHIGIAHVNHSLRGKAADWDEAFVKTFSLKNNYPYFQTKVNVRSKATGNKLSIEEAARHLRYSFLEEVARKYGYTKICTAHHGSDQAETVLMRVIKGAGWTGLTGIRETRGLYVRPLLIFTKDEIRSYVKYQKIDYVEDRTNLNQKIFRNRIRHNLIPLLKRNYDPQIEKHLLQLGIIANETRRLSEKSARRLFSTVCTVSEGKILLEIKAFNRYLRAQRQAILELIFTDHFDRTLQFSEYQNLIELAETKQSGKRILTGSIECSRTSSEIVFQRFQKKGAHPFCHAITLNCTYRFDNPGCSFVSEEIANSSALQKQFGKSVDTEFLDAGKITGRLILRSWKKGDRFIPLGMKGFKNLSDFFIDRKVPLKEKGRTPILIERKGKRDNIIWICGHRIDDRYKTDHLTQRILKLKCERYEKDH